MCGPRALFSSNPSIPLVTHYSDPCNTSSFDRFVNISLKLMGHSRIARPSCNLLYLFIIYYFHPTFITFFASLLSFPHPSYHSVELLNHDTENLSKLIRIEESRIHPTKIILLLPDINEILSFITSNRLDTGSDQRFMIFLIKA